MASRRGSYFQRRREFLFDLRTMYPGVPSSNMSYSPATDYLKKQRRKAARNTIEIRVKERETPNFRGVECVICGRMFVDCETRHRHCLMEHTDGERPFKCRVCWKGFLYYDLCREHQERVHSFTAMPKSAGDIYVVPRQPEALPNGAE